MTIHGWGSAMYMSQLSDEFGNYGAPYYLSHFYAGGGKVPAGTVGYPSGGGAVGIPASGWISLNNFYGASRIIDITYTVTVGLTSWGDGTLYGYRSGVIGAIDNATFFGGGTIFAIQQWYHTGGNPVYVIVQGNVPNSGWNSVTFSETSTLTRTYNRWDASYSFDGTYTTWSWPNSGGEVSISPGAPVYCRFVNF